MFVTSGSDRSITFQATRTQLAFLSLTDWLPTPLGWEYVETELEMIVVVANRSNVIMIVGTLIVAGLTWYVSTQVHSMNAKGMSPVIGFSAPSYQMDFFGDATRDPAVAKSQPADQTDATRVAQEIKEFRDDLTRSKGERAQEFHEQLYLSYAALAYYFEDIVSGHSTEAYDRSKAQDSLASVRNLLIQHAEAFQKSSKSNSQKFRALFHINATMYMAGQNKGKAVANLKAMSGKFGSILSDRADFLVALHDLNQGNIKAKLDAAKKFTRIAANMGSESKAAANVIAARSLAGITASGSRSHAAAPEYRKYLTAAAAGARQLEGSQKEKVISVVVSIWRKAEGARIDWTKAPYALQNFADLNDSKAIIEQIAIAEYGRGNKTAAIRKYKSLAASFEGQARKGDLDLRLVDMYHAEYLTSKSATAFEGALVNLSKDYLDTGILGQGNETKAKSVGAELARRYKGLVYQVMAKAGKGNVSRGERLQAIAMADRYLGTTSDNKEIEGVKSTVANLYVLNKQHGEAVALYKELAETNTSGQSYRYLALATKSQTVLAKWSDTAPWNGMSAGFSGEREELLSLYKKLGDADKSKHNWFFTAQVGLLEVNLNRVEQAFNVWQAALEKEPIGGHAARAAGFMLTAHNKANDWTSLEALSRLCLKHKLLAIHLDKKVDVVGFLALALLEGGKDAMEQGKFDVAVAKLKEFVSQHQTHKRHDEGFFTLASAYRGATQHELAIKTLQAFVERYPSSQYYRQALLNGGDWSSMMAYEENMIFFFAHFQERFATDSEAPRVRRDLVAIYLGRALYADAISTMNAMLSAKNQPAEDKVWSVVTLMETEDKHGTPARAEKAADLIIRSAGITDDNKADALVLKARYAVKKRNVAQINAVEAKLTTLSGGQQVADALGEVRYMLAFANAGAANKEYYNLEVKDPAKLLNKRFEDYKIARAAFLKVCSNENAFCAPSMYRLARVSDDFAKTLESIEIQETLAKEVVQGFKNQKQAIMNYISSTIQKADSQAVATVGQGQTDPDWAQAVLWQNSADWNFDRVSGETGNGYVQWSTATEAD